MQLAGAVGQMQSSTQHPACPNHQPFAACRGRRTEPGQVRGHRLPLPPQQDTISRAERGHLACPDSWGGERVGYCSCVPSLLLLSEKTQGPRHAGTLGMLPAARQPGWCRLHAASKWSPFCLLNETDTALLIVY